MIIYGIAGAMLCFTAYMIVKGKKEHQEELERFYQLSKNKVEVIPASSGWTSMQIGIMLLMVFMTVYVVQHPEQSGSEDATGFLLVCVAMLIVIIMNLTMLKKYQDLFVNKDGFMDRGKVVRFTSIKSVEPKLTGCTVYTYSNQEIRLSSAQGKALMQLLEEREQTKKTK